MGAADTPSVSNGEDREKRRSCVLGVGGSPRKGGNSDLLLAQLLNGVKAHATRCHAIQLRDYQYTGCIGCEKCRRTGICTGLRDGMSLLYPHIIHARGMILVSPTHHYNITSWMKSFIDRLYCFYHFQAPRPGNWSSRLAGQGRKAVIGAVCEQNSPKDMGFTLDAMRYPLEALGYEIVAELPVYGIFDRAKIKQHPEIMTRARKIGHDLARSLTIAPPTAFSGPSMAGG